MYIYSSLINTSYREIANCLNSAFSDYAIEIQLNEEQIQNRLEMSGINKELSYGAFWDHELVGFILNSCNVYHGEKVAFDIGTGITPAHRGNKVFTKLFEFNKEELRKHSITKYYLEVIQQNDKAISIYRKQGFDIIREFSVLKSTQSIQKPIHTQVSFIDYDDFTYEISSDCICPTPSYENNTNILRIKPDSYKVILLEKKSKLSAFCVFQKKDGSIVQLGYTDTSSLKIIIEQLLLQFKSITAKNIDLHYKEVLDVFKTIGFTEVVKQYEMLKTID